MSNTNIQSQPNKPFLFEPKPKNDIGTAGFILSLVALFFGWIPFFGWVIWLVGLVLSIIGATKNPKKLAIAGIIISFIGIFLLIVLFGVGALASLAY